MSASSGILRYASAALLLLRAAEAAPAATDCYAYIPEAERHFGLPSGLLSAVAMVESGRDGEPYPWALNIGGRTVDAPDFAAAARLLRGPDGAPREDAAVGCMQIYLRYHLDRLRTPEWALIPSVNVWYGARYLRELRDRYGDWTSAVAHYHGSDPTAERDYVIVPLGVV